MNRLDCPVAVGATEQPDATDEALKAARRMATDDRVRTGPHGGLIKLCEGRTRHDHVPCRNPATRGRDFCRLHGGKIPVGVRAARFKHGRYSQFITNPDLQARLETIEADPKINSLRDNIEAVLFVRALAAVAREFVPPEQVGEFVARVRLLAGAHPGGSPALRGDGPDSRHPPRA